MIRIPYDEWLHIHGYNPRDKCHRCDDGYIHIIDEYPYCSSCDIIYIVELFSYAFAQYDSGKIKKCGMEKMTTKEATVWYLRHIGYTQDEIALLLGNNRTRAHSLIGKIIKRRMLNE